MIKGGTGTNSIKINHGAAAIAAQTFDFDNITDVLTINVTGTGTDTNAQSVGVTFATITESTSQTVTLDASGLTDVDDDLTVTNSAASSTTKFAITGGAGDDTLAGSLGDDTITGGTGIDVVTGAGGSDVFAYAAKTDSLVTDGSAAIEASDIIKDFTDGADKIAINFSGISFGGMISDANAALAAGKLYVVETNESDAASIDGDTAGADSGAGKAAFILINTTANAITPAANTGAKIEETTGLMVIRLEAQSGVDYGAIFTAADFTFAA